MARSRRLFTVLFIIILTLFCFFLLSILLFCVLTVRSVLAPRTSATAYQSNNKPPTHPSHYRPLATTCIVGILAEGPGGFGSC